MVKILLALGSPFSYLLSPGYESLRVALGLFISLSQRKDLPVSIPQLGIFILLALTRWCLAVSGNLLPHSRSAERAGSATSALSLGDTWLWGQCLHVPQQEPSLGVIPAAHPALLFNQASSEASLMLSLGSVPDGCLQEGFYGNQGQEKPAHQVQCSNVRDPRAGRGVIPSEAEARAWWRGLGRFIYYTCLGTRRDSLSTLLPWSKHCS